MMNKLSTILFLIILSSLALFSCSQETPEKQEKQEARKMKALIIDGQNNHGIWPKTTMMIKSYLEETGLFEVDIARTPLAYQGPHNDGDTGMNEEKRLKLRDEYAIPGMKITWLPEPVPNPDYAPEFSKYDVVVSNFGNTAPLPGKTREAFEKYVSNGGGLVIIHGANNSWGDWTEFNRMIGLGAWGGRNEKTGPFVYYNDANELVRDTAKGESGSHGHQYAYLITLRDTTHPVTQGMPKQWMHMQDEMYDRMRGPAENMSVLATTYSDEEKNASFFTPLRGTNRHEPMMLTVNYGKGRVFQTPMGHADYSMECVGFIVTIQRGAEWAATGKVTQTQLPHDFPTAGKVSQRIWKKK